ncbi:transcription factor bHLH123-like [Impatiens glandulifera]|uniref:transcription factor bHLH123-like n=1 Tax=Impatiens glandulifera TaxID=253017 RepID=UPI001FB18BB5|nr:transcription factor bHLH123-like [Impatiens glandulifera]
MADEFQVGSGNWWDSSRIPSSSAMDSGAPSVSGSSNINLMFQENQKRLQIPDHSSTASILTADSDMQMMGLNLSSHQTIDWNPNLLRDGEKTESSSFRSMIQEDQLRTAPNFYHHQEQWRQPKLFSGPGASSEDSTGNDFKQTNLGFSLDNQPEFISSSSGGGGGGSEAVVSYSSDPTVGYGSPSTILLQGLLASDQDNRQSPLTGDYPFPTNYGLNSGEMMSAPWSKFPQFMRNSPPSQPQPQFSNSSSFWNSPLNSDTTGRPGFFQSVQPPPPFLPPATFEEKPKINQLEDRDLGGATGTKNNNYNNINTSEASSYKRARSEATPSPLPAFKVRKEKMGDRITALQQLVSPFGKTDTASVLSEAIEYIKFLHEQVSVLSSPYMKIGISMQQQQNQQISLEKSRVENEGAKSKDLRSRGLCLVPVSSTYPVTHEPTVDYWNPTFGGSFR